MDRYQLGTCQLHRNATSNDLLLLAKGPTLYKSVLSRAFPGLYFSRAFPDRFGRFDWGTYIQGADAAAESSLRGFCDLLQQAVLIDDDLDECFALSFHTQTSAAGGYQRTRVGQLVREAKPYDRSGSRGDRDKAAELARMLADFIRQHPTYSRACVLAAVPPSNPDKDFDLPAVLAEEAARITGQQAAARAVRKTRVTRPMKQCRTVQDKVNNLRGAFCAEASAFQGKQVILIDDIYETGFSINEVGRTVRAAGAALVLGLAATKTAQDLTEDLDRKEGGDDLPF